MINHQSLDSLLHHTNDDIAVLANAASFLYMTLTDVNWVGFYIKKGNRLTLGPFQGLPACVEIQMGKGACGSAAQEKRTVILNDVTLVENYIACHDETRSEIVIPIVVQGDVVAVLDIDSTTIHRFTASDQSQLELMASIISKHLQFKI